MLCIILIAAPAAGKGTISKYIEEKYNYKHISMGDLLRDEVKNETEIGLMIKPLIEKGSLVDDDVIEDIFKREFKKTKENIVLDGLPRTISQARMLDKLDEVYDDVKITKVINIDIDKEIAINRIKSRLICEDCGFVYNKNIIKENKCTKCGGNLLSRNDDALETFLDRYETFVKQTKPLLNYYGDKVVTIYNNTTLEDVFKQVDEILKGDE